MLETKRLIADAFSSLLKSKAVDKITVKDIVENCGITRQTFYYHFQDILDVLEWILKEGEETMLEKSMQAESLRENIYMLVKLSLIDQADIIKKLMNSQKREKTEQLLIDTCKSYLAEMVYRKEMLTGMKNSDREAIVSFYTYGVVGFLFDNLMKGNKDIEAVTDQLCMLIE